MREDKKEQILQAAVECFIDYGYNKTSMSDIGRKVGLNKASLYYHFKDKLTLFEAVILQKRSAHVSSISRELENITASHDRILHFLCREIDFIEELAINYMADNHKKSETQPCFQNMIKEIGLYLSGLLNDTDNPDETAQLILQTCRGLLLIDCPLDAPRSERSEGYQKVRENIRKVVKLMLKGL